MPQTYRALLTVDSTTVGFETTCEQAYTAFQRRRTLFDDIDHAYRADEQYDALTIPRVVFVDGPSYQADFDPVTETLRMAAPWPQISGSTLLPMAVWLVAELVRQRRGEYILHASAVVRDGHAMVLFGPAEAGKTTAALHLALHHGFSLLANDEIRVTLRHGAPWIISGDPTFRFRYTSLRDYSPELCHRVFDGQDLRLEQPWRIKRKVPPASVGVAASAPDVRIAAFVLLKLDAGVKPDVERLRDGETRGAMFRTRADLYEHLTALIRGAAYAPLVNDLRYVPLLIPSLDCSEFVHKRIAFLDALFAGSQVVRARGSVSELADELVRNHFPSPQVT